MRMALWNFERHLVSFVVRSSTDHDTIIPETVFSLSKV